MVEPSAPNLSPTHSGSSADNAIEKPPPYEEAIAATTTINSASSPLITKQPSYSAPANFGAIPQAVAPPPVVVVSQGIPSLSPYPVSCVCPHCNCAVVTLTTPVSGMLQYVACCILCFFGCIFGCCLIPFCMDGLGNVEHKCPRCYHLLGFYRRC